GGDAAGELVFLLDLSGGASRTADVEQPVADVAVLEIGTQGVVARARIARAAFIKAVKQGRARPDQPGQEIGTRAVEVRFEAQGGGIAVLRLDDEDGEEVQSGHTAAKRSLQRAVNLAGRIADALRERPPVAVVVQRA